eukprot:UN01757
MILPDFHLKYFLFEQTLTKILTTRIVSFFFDHTVLHKFLFDDFHEIIVTSQKVLSQIIFGF